MELLLQICINYKNVCKVKPTMTLRTLYPEIQAGKYFKFSFSLHEYVNLFNISCLTFFIIDLLQVILVPQQSLDADTGTSSPLWNRDWNIGIFPSHMLKQKWHHPHFLKTVGRRNVNSPIIIYFFSVKLWYWRMTYNPVTQITDWT